MASYALVADADLRGRGDCPSPHLQRRRRAGVRARRRGRPRGDEAPRSAGGLGDRGSRCRGWMGSRSSPSCASGPTRRRALVVALSAFHGLRTMAARMKDLLGLLGALGQAAHARHLAPRDQAGPGAELLHAHLDARLQAAAAGDRQHPAADPSRGARAGAERGGQADEAGRRIPRRLISLSALLAEASHAVEVRFCPSTFDRRKKPFR